MIGLLAEMTDASVPARVTERLQSLRIPSQGECIEFLTAMQPVWGCLLVACGLVYLLHGWKIFKILVAVNAAILGVLLGGKLAALIGGGQNLPLLAAIGGGLVLSVLAWPLMKYSISVMGGLAGSFLGLGLWNYAAQVAHRPGLGDYAWAGALVGLVTLGLLAFVLFRFVVITFTACQGALMTVAGVVAILLKFDRVTEPITEALVENIHLLPLLIGVPAIIGFTFQNSAALQKAKKKKMAAAGASGGGGG